MSKVHQTALKSFNLNHANYDVLRPSFLPPIVNQFLVDLNLAEKTSPDSFTFKTDKKILELAAGTGKFTKNLVNNGWKGNLTVAEPSTGMLESFTKNFPEVTAVNGSSYKLPLADNSVDVVIAAQAFHWFSDLDSLKEIQRVLKPHGAFGCIWNFDCPSISQTLHKPYPKLNFFFENVSQEATNKFIKLSKSLPLDDNLARTIGEEFFKLHPWSREVSQYIYTFDTGVPQYRHGDWKKLLEKENDFFTPITHENFMLYVSEIKREQIYEYWETRSYITALSTEERKKIKEHISTLLKENVTNDDIVDGNSDLLRKAMGTHSIVLQSKK
ncbi:uncharacterized protein PRCAT00003431001 [Priceomyces carsonii]|uniref:uncharacterized protein n=1 Tax=Priceomyces carsonii TaxID=28549 RepID=UPI002EDA0C15|nr:unnamed protein product [Priceomyces carsonii]